MYGKRLSVIGKQCFTNPDQYIIALVAYVITFWLAFQVKCL